MKLLLSVLPILLLGSVLVGCGDATTSTQHVAEAEVLLQDGKQKAAVIELKNALQKDANNGEARWLLGQLYYETGDKQNAQKELRLAMDAGVTNDDIVPLYAKTLLAQHQNEPLEQLSPEGLTPEGYATLQAAKGLSRLERGDLVGARAFMSEARTADSAPPFVLLAGAQLSLAERLEQKALKQIEDTLVAFPDYAPAWSIKGDVANRAGNLADAESAYTRAIETASNGFSDLLKRAIVRINLKQNAAAQEDINSLKALAAKHPGVSFAQGVLRMQEGDLEGAKTSLELAARFGDQIPQAYYYLAAIYLSEDNLLRARDYINRFLAVDPDNVLGRKLSATLELKDQNFARAEEMIRPVIAFYPEDVSALNLLANALFAQGKQGEGIDVLADIATQNPDSAQAQARLGAGYLSIGEDAAGIESLQQSLALSPEYQQADILIILNHLNHNESAAAIAAATDFRERNPDSIVPYQLLGRAYIAANKAAEAKAALEQALKLSPGDPASHHSLATLALTQQDFEGARAQYNAVLEQHPDHLATMIAMAASYALENKEEPMLAALEDAATTHPTAVEPRLVMAKHFVNHGEAKRAREILNSLPEAQQKLPQVVSTLSAIQMAEGNYSAAVRTLDQLLALQPRDARYHFLKAKALAAMGDNRQASVELEETIGLAPDHLFSRIALARLYNIRGQADKFDQQLIELNKVAPENPDVLQLNAAAANERGNRARALELLETLHTLSPSTASLLLLAHQRDLMGDKAGAITQLLAWTEAHNDDNQARIALAKYYFRSAQAELAIKQYQKVLEVDPDNLTTLNNMAWIMLEKDPEHALQLAERANRLAPDSASVLDTYAIASLKNDNLEQARKLIDRAVKLSPDNAALRFHDIQIKAAEGFKQEAAASLNKLLAQDTQFSERVQAEKMLKQLQ